METLKRLPSLAKEYLSLTKPGILVGNGINALGGFFLSSSSFDFFLLSYMLSGLLLVMASACICNNYIDQEMDSKMERTKARAFVRGTISPKKALVVASFLFIYGIFVLYAYTTFLAVFCAFLGFFTYVGVYSFSKYYVSFSTLLGSIAGAMPPLVGYFSVKGSVDIPSFLLFLLLVSWQMPHFLAIAIYRMEDYKRADIPTVPIKKGMASTKKEMLFYVVLFVATSFLLPFFLPMTLFYKVILCSLGGFWLFLSIQGFFEKEEALWARKMFFFSLVVVLGLFICFVERFLFF